MTKKLTFLIFSGPTKEYIDPVRFISNESSGKMGNAIARSVLKKKHNIIFISGPASVFPENIKPIKITSAMEMFKEVKVNFKKADIIIGVAAVADYRPIKIYRHKIKKNSPRISIELKRNPDIIRYCGKNKKNQIVVGFALETRDLINNAKFKLENKNLDLIVVNGKKSFNSDNTTVFLISSDVVLEIKNKNKKIIAERILNETIRIFEDIKFGKKIF
jgi:phosphopantothenoylcysteine synthetase/decarboxylase